MARSLIKSWRSPVFFLNMHTKWKFRFTDTRKLVTTSTNDHLDINLNGKVHSVNTVWLRENCRCDSCYTHSTNQRHVLFHQLNATDTKPRDQMKVGDDLQIIWNDGHTSVYNSVWLSEHLESSNNTCYMIY